MQHVGGYELFKWFGGIFMGHKSDLCDYTVQKHDETDKAWCVSDDGVRKNAVWVPKSQCELEPSDDGKAYILTLPEWLAIEKGLA